jgi:D-threonine aldolase
MDASLYRLNDTSALVSPSLLVFRDLVKQNLETMIEMAGKPERLRPHVKTHKMPAVVKLSESMRIKKHKAATIAEAEMVARAGGTDVLLAYPLVGPNVGRLARLARAFPGTTFRTLVDHPDSARALSAGLEGVPKPIPVLLDLEIGMGRTGIEPGDAAADLYALLDRLPNLVADGLHAYDGQVHQGDLPERRHEASPGLQRALALRDRLLARGMKVPRMVVGGTPTFPVHATLDVPGLELSPGTCTLHDVGYASNFPDMHFTPAAAILTRVISTPRAGRICLDVGHKSVAADPPAGQRLILPDLPNATIGGQSEEHLVVDTPDAAKFPPGTPLLAFPVHICPTCALHRFAYVIADGNLVDQWEVGARDRVLEF